MANLEQAVQNMVNMCNDNSYGYQLGGWGPYDFDCASSIITALRNAGFDTGAAQYTGNMSAELCARGWTRLAMGTELKRGDILLNEVNHTAMYVGNNQVAEFSSDYDGVSGDSSGNEASVHGYYDFPDGWDCILRYTSGGGSVVTIPKAEGHIETGAWTGIFYTIEGDRVHVTRGFITDVEFGVIDVTANIISSNERLTIEEMLPNAKYILKYLTARGWTRNAVCGMLGNMQTESYMNPGVWQDLIYGNYSGGYGLVQWTPATKYTDWANTMGYEIGDIDGQLERIIWEKDNGQQWIPTSNYPMSFAEFSTSTDSPYNLAMAFIACYERPEVPYQPIRGEQAEYWDSIL